MANRNFRRVQALDNEIKLVSGRFSIDTGAATKVAGIGWSVEGTDTGEFTITLEDAYPALISAQACIEVAGGAAVFAQVESHNALGKTVIVNTVNATGTPSAVDCSVHFVLVLRNSTVA